jgi:hypothetical protein
MQPEKGEARVIRVLKQMDGWATGRITLVSIVAAIGLALMLTAPGAMASTFVDQTIEGTGTNITGVSCVPGKKLCFVADSNGDVLYAEPSTTGETTWHLWHGWSYERPGWGVSCPTTSFCVFLSGSSSSGGGSIYSATSLGGTWTQVGWNGTEGDDAVSCPSESFCLAAGINGNYRYSTEPTKAGAGSWGFEGVGSTTINAVSCLSNSFCVFADASGKVHVATTPHQLQYGWEQTTSTVDSGTALNGIVCTSTSRCVAVDTADKVLNLTISSSGVATVTKEQSLEENHEPHPLRAVTCAGNVCVIVDNQGRVFVSTNTGESWAKQYSLGHELTSVSCTSSELCVTGDSSGNVTTFNPTSTQAVTQSLHDPAGTPLNAVSCIPGSSECVVTDGKGNALFTKGAKTNAETEWTHWEGPIASPSDAITCPSSSLCMFADGKLESGQRRGGNMYYATALGGKFKLAFEPGYGVVSITCPTNTFCLDGQEADGYLRYSTVPASQSWWPTVELNEDSGFYGVACLSESFCAAVDTMGALHVATTAAHVKEPSGWQETDIDGTTALTGIACISTASCVAVDSAGNVLLLAINGSGGATVTKETFDAGHALSGISCTGSTCIVVDASGDVFASANGGESWGQQYSLGDDLTGVSCASTKLCVATDTTGEVMSFLPDASYEGFSAENQPPASWRPYSSASVWDKEVETAHLELEKESGAVVTKLLERPHPENLVAGNIEAQPIAEPGKGGDFGHPVYWARPSDPLYKLVGDEEGKVECAHYPSPLNDVSIRIPVGAQPADGGDRHMAVVEPNGTEYDVWHAKVVSAPSGSKPGEIEFACGTETQISGSGLGGEATESGFALAAGIIRPSEMREGVIDHPLFMVTEHTNEHVYPASGGHKKCGTSCTAVPPVGARFFLNMEQSKINALHDPWARTIATALRKYGAYIGDTGGGHSFGFEFESPESTLAFGSFDPMKEFAELEFCARTTSEKPPCPEELERGSVNGIEEYKESGWRSFEYVFHPSEKSTGIEWGRLEWLKPPTS